MSWHVNCPRICLYICGSHVSRHQHVALLPWKLSFCHKDNVLKNKLARDYSVTRMMVSEEGHQWKLA